MTIKKVKHDYPFTNDYMFSTLMNNPQYCKELLNRILPDKKVSEVTVLNDINQNLYVQNQKTINYDLFAKGVRLDVVFEDDEAIYNVEMQCAHQDDLQLRARYYGSQLDMEQIPKVGDYRDLRQTYVIFICTFDLFHLGESIYSFATYDIEKQLKLDDKKVTIFINTRGSDKLINKGLKNLFQYINNNEIDDEDGFLCEIEKEIQNLNREDGEWRRHIMKLEEKINMEKRDAMEAGVQMGIEKSMNKVAKDMKNKKYSVEEIREITGLSKEEIKNL